MKAMGMDGRTLFGALMLLLAVPLPAAQHFESGAAQTLMIELYTSQGCSSCPPAETLLNGFVDNPRLWSHFVPLAFHVDYWDYIGWRDRYALPENAQRQRRYATLANTRTVYTPAFVVNGRGWRPGWFDKAPGGDTRQVGALSVTLHGERFEARFHTPDPEPPRLELHIAVLGMGLATAIRAGENAGRDSRHEFVVLRHEVFSGDGARWQGRVVALADPAVRGGALAAWVSRPGDPTPLQATGGYLLAGDE